MSRGWSLLLGRRRVLVTLLLSLALCLALEAVWQSGIETLIPRVLGLGFAAMLVYGVLEQWPRRLPGWCARWVLQVLGVALAMPFCTLIMYEYSTEPGAPDFWSDNDRLIGFAMLSATGMLIAPWTALAALVRQKDALARHQALAFNLERSELERQAVNARLHLLQAQVAPHFLFNTLANVKALVDSSSPQASAVLASLIAYLRAAVPRLHEPATTLGQELQLVKAYLELMHMRMPDRLQFGIEADDSAKDLRCPPMTLLTLVENAVRHGIDPSEEGGRIDIRVLRRGNRLSIIVADTGVGLRDSGDGLGTGLATLRERLQLLFAGDALLRVDAQQPQGVRAEVEIPARGARE
jgi:glucose-6-phosphate-specific signal transduction histidine kinase